MSLLRDRKHTMIVEPRTHRVGDWVWRFYPPSDSPKIGQGWTGPYLVVHKFTDLTYSIQKSHQSPIVNAHVDDMKPYEGQNPPQSWLNNDYNLSASVDEHVILSQESNDSHFQNGPFFDHLNTSERVEDDSKLNDESFNDILPFRPNDESIISDPVQMQNKPVACPSVHPQTNVQRKAGVPIIRSRRKRGVRPRQFRSPS